MKIGDIEVGAEYAAHDNPQAKGYYARKIRPRQVKVVEIVTREETQYGGAWSPSKKVNIRRVKVEFLDDPVSKSSYRVAAKPKGQQLVIEARKLIGPWSQYSTQVAKQIREKQEEDAAEAALDKRIEALFGKGLQNRSGGYAYGDVSRYGGKLRETLRVEGTCVDQLLTWAEAGKAAS